MSGDRSRWTGWLLVGGQFVLLAAIAFEWLRVHRWRPWRLVIAAPLFAAGALGIAGGSRQLGRALRAHPAPAPEAVLRTTGLYARVRHPIYAGVLLVAFGSAVLAGSRLALAWFAALVALLNLKARFEERLLRARFAGYEAYARRTPRFLPRPGSLLRRSCR